jgi:hypothetical protein
MGEGSRRPSSRLMTAAPPLAARIPSFAAARRVVSTKGQLSDEEGHGEANTGYHAEHDEMPLARC